MGEKSPPGTLKRRESSDQRAESCRDWCARYSQSFLNKTLPPLATNEDEEDPVSPGVDDAKEDKDELPTEEAEKGPDDPAKKEESETNETVSVAISE